MERHFTGLTVKEFEEEIARIERLLGLSKPRDYQYQSWQSWPMLKKQELIYNFDTLS